MSSVSYGGIAWVGIAVRHQDGTITAIEMDERDFITMDMVREFEPIESWGDLLHWEPSRPSRTRIAIEARDFRMWQQGADAAKAQAPLEIEAVDE